MAARPKRRAPLVLDEPARDALEARPPEGAQFGPVAATARTAPRRSRAAAARRRRAARRGCSRRNRSSASWMKLPRAAASGGSSIGIERAAAAGYAAHRSHRDRASGVSICVTESLRGRAATGGRGAAARARLPLRTPAGVSSRRCQAMRLVRGVEFAFSMLDGAQHRVEPQQPARRHGRRALDPRRARQPHLAARRAPCAKSCAAMPIRPSGGGRPKAWRIGRDSHGSLSVCGGQTPSLRPPRIMTIGALQPRLEQAPDGEARMTAETRPHHRPGDQRLEQRGIVAAGDRGEVGSGGAELGDELRRRSRRRPRRHSRSAPVSASLRASCFGRRDMRRDQLAQRLASRAPSSVDQRRQRRARAAPRDRRARGRRAATRRNPARPGAGRGPRRHCVFEPPRRARGMSRARSPPAASGCFSSASSGTGASSCARRVEDQAQEHAGRRAVERHAGGIVDLDVPALQLGGDAARQLAVGRDQRGGLLRRLLQRLPQQQRDGLGLFLRAGAIEAAQIATEPRRS